MFIGDSLDVAIEHCNKATSLATTAGPNEIGAFAESCLTQGYLFAGRLQEAISTGERALASFEARGDLWWAVRTIPDLSPTAIALGGWDRSVSYCRRAVEHGATLNNARPKVIGLWRMGATYIQQGDLERGARCCNEALELQPPPYDIIMAKAARGYGQIKAGEIDRILPRFVTFAEFDPNSPLDQAPPYNNLPYQLFYNLSQLINSIYTAGNI